MMSVVFILPGMSVWKAKTSSTGSNTMIMESQSNKPEPDVLVEVGPGKSFRNFRIDTASVLQAMDAGFST